MWPMTTLGFRYNRGQWRLGCQVGLIASAALSTGIQGWYAGGSTYGSGSWSGGDGSGLGSNEIRFQGTIAMTLRNPVPYAALADAR